MDENAVKNACIDLLRYRGFLVLRINSGARSGEHTNKKGVTKKWFLNFATWFIQGAEPQTAGVSDILAIEPETGRLWAIETKRKGRLREVSLLQAAFLEAVRERGGVGIVVDDVELLEAEIENTKEQT